MVELKSYQIICKESPLDAEEVWRIESFLLKIFEYGNYSFRRALTGTYHKALKCIFYLAYKGDNIVGAAGCLFSAGKPFSAIFGPVAVEPNHQSRGIATELCSRMLEDLQDRRIKRVYLAVSNNNSARKLYHQLGFYEYTGIVMRKDFCRFEPDHPDKYLDIIYSDLSWQDYAEVLALVCEPSSFMTVDYQRGLFSSKCEPIKRLLPIFPEIMRQSEENEGYAKIMKQDETGEVIGLAQIRHSQSELQRHIADLDFFSKDGYVTHIESLVKQISLEHKEKQVCQLRTWVSEPDELKKGILENLGAKRIAMLPNTLITNEKMYNVEVFQF